MSIVTKLNSLNLVTLTDTAKGSRANAHSNGDKGQPCLVPCFRSNERELKPFVRTAACGDLYILFLSISQSYPLNQHVTELQTNISTPVGQVFSAPIEITMALH